MWTTVRRSLQAPSRMIHTLTRILVLLEEQNNLLRELHLDLTHRPALTKRSSQRLDASAGSRPRMRNANDVWQRTPLSSLRAAELERNDHEQAASTPISFQGSSEDGKPPSEPERSEQP